MSNNLKKTMNDKFVKSIESEIYDRVSEYAIDIEKVVYVLDDGLNIVFNKDNLYVEVFHNFQDLERFSYKEYSEEFIAEAIKYAIKIVEDKKQVDINFYKKYKESKRSAYKKLEKEYHELKESFKAAKIQDDELKRLIEDDLKEFAENIYRYNLFDSKIEEK